MTVEVDVAVIGAGQAGLSAAYFLRRAGYRPDESFVVFDRSPSPGGAWQFRWPSLTFDTVHGIHRLPGAEQPQPSGPVPVAPALMKYFAEYEQRFELRVHRPVSVHSVSEAGDGRLYVDSDQGRYLARALINASGTWERPFVPRYPGTSSFAGQQLHTVDYRGPAEFTGRRVVVIGGGASAIQLLSEISTVADTLWVTRRPVEFSDRPFDVEWGRDVEAEVDARVRAGLPPGSVISATGYHLTPQIEEAQRRGVLRRRPMFDRVTGDGVAWEGGGSYQADVLLWATGFRPVLNHLAPLRLRNTSGGITMDGTQVADDRRIHLVGYGPSASTLGANRAGRRAVRALTAWLPSPSASVPAHASGAGL